MASKRSYVSILLVVSMNFSVAAPYSQQQKILMSVGCVAAGFLIQGGIDGHAARAVQKRNGIVLPLRKRSLTEHCIDFLAGMLSIKENFNRKKQEVETLFGYGKTNVSDPFLSRLHTLATANLALGVGIVCAALVFPVCSKLEAMAEQPALREELSEISLPILKECLAELFGKYPEESALVMQQGQLGMLVVEKTSLPRVGIATFKDLNKPPERTFKKLPQGFLSDDRFLYEPSMRELLLNWFAEHPYGQLIKTGATEFNLMESSDASGGSDAGPRPSPRLTGHKAPKGASPGFIPFGGQGNILGNQ